MEANWTSLPLYPRGGGPYVSYDIEIDSQGRPRLAFYQEELLQGQGKRLFYVWCNVNCLAGENWQSIDLGLGQLNGQDGLWDGLTPSLALDGSGTVRLAYDATYYARCIYIPETGEWKPWQVFNLVWRTVRVKSFVQP